MAPRDPPRPRSTTGRPGALLVAAGVALLLGTGAAWALDPQRPFHDFVRDQWSLESGLPQISVLSITQDDGGFIWVGTQNGIARFDGVRFVPVARGAGGVAATLVRDALRDRAGVLWFAHERGVLRYADGAYANHATQPEPQIAYAVAEAPDGRILATTDSGLFEAREGRLVPAGLDHPRLRAMEVAPDGALWIGTFGAVLRHGAGATIRHDLPAAPRAEVTAVSVGDDAVWIGSSSGLFRLPNGADAALAVPELAGESILSMLHDRHGTLWVGTPTALWRLRPDAPPLRHAGDSFVRNPWVASLFEDRDGNLWVGSENEGLLRLADGWISRLGAESGLHDPLAWSIERAADGALLVGTDRGVARYAQGRFDLLVKADDLPNAVAYELAADRSGRLWIGTRAGLARLDAGGATPTRIAAVGDAQVNAVVPTDDGTVWIGTSDGVFLWQGDDDLEQVYPGGPGPAHRVRGVLPLGPRRALLATEAGVRLLADGVADMPSWAQPMEGAFVTSIDRVQDDLLVVTSIDRGVGVQSADRLALLDREPELQRLSAWGARVVGERVYIAAAEGVVSVPVADLQAYWRDPAAPLDWRVPASVAGTLRGSQRARCCNGGARSRLLVDGDRLWLPTIEGIIALRLDDLDRVAEAPVVHIEAARHAGHAVALPPPQASLLLDAASRDLAVSFTAIAHRDPKGLRFAYRLEGFDPDWVDAGERREAFYTNLPPGDYTFRVRAESAARTPSAQDAVLAVSVPPRWHERTAARAGAVIALAALLLLAMRAVLTLRERAFAAREARLQRVVDERTAELAHANARLREANRALAQESETDPLTGLPNRRWLSGHLGDWLREGGAAPGDGTCALLVMFDLDRFKDINARLGHAAGDALLRQFGALLERLAGTDGKVLRWGGEEFLLVARGVPRAQAAARVAALWRAAQEHLHPAPDGTPILLPSSVGYSTHPLAADAAKLPWSVALELADAAAWRARLEARNGWGGLLLADGADPQQLAAGIEGRLEALLRAGVLRWERIGAATAPPR